MNRIAVTRQCFMADVHIQLPRWRDAGQPAAAPREFVGPFSNRHGVMAGLPFSRDLTSSSVSGQLLSISYSASSLHVMW